MSSQVFAFVLATVFARTFCLDTCAADEMDLCDGYCPSVELDLCDDICSWEDLDLCDTNGSTATETTSMVQGTMNVAVNANAMQTKKATELGLGSLMHGQGIGDSATHAAGMCSATVSTGTGGRRLQWEPSQLPVTPRKLAVTNYAINWTVNFPYSHVSTMTSLVANITASPVFLQNAMLSAFQADGVTSATSVTITNFKQVNNFEQDTSAASPGASRLTTAMVVLMSTFASGQGRAFLLVAAMLGLASDVEAAKPTNCAEVKTLYKDSSCCGNPAKAVTVDPSCPYNFNKPACKDAEAQAPRDLSTNAAGSRIPKSVVLNKAQAALIPLTNVHFHLGAEHKSNNYNDATASNTFDNSGGRRLAAGAVRPGWFCPAATAAETATAYTFQYCKGDVAVGKTYEIHYVHSSAGYTAAEIAANANIDGIDDGLGGAANGRGQLNPMVVVQAQVFQIVTGTSAPTVSNMHSGWQAPPNGASADIAVMYPGSTTGPSHTNSVCSPYAISWHVDKRCHKVSAASFDDMCKKMKEQYNLDADLYPHGSRELLSPSWVVPASHVVQLA